MTLTKDWLDRFNWPRTLLTGHPLAIAHRGASDYGPENTLLAFSIAAELCAEMWELDVRLSADGVCVVSHDDDLERVSGQSLKISESSWSEIRALKLARNQHVSRLEEVIKLAKAKGCGLYVELKAPGTGPVALALLRQADFNFACLGSFDARQIAQLRHLGCEYPLSVLVPTFFDPIAYLGDSQADIIHLCWRNGAPSPDQLLTPELLARLKEYQIVLWDEDRAKVVEQLLGKPVMGICSNRPEMLKPYRTSPERAIDIVCHRGANNLVPENTLEAAQICINQGFEYVELDVRTSADGELVVIHDSDLDRTTNGAGPVVDQRLTHIQSLDAGSWFSGDPTAHKVPSLEEFLTLAQGQSRLYVEIKQADPAALLAAIEAHDMLDKCFFWSADISILCGLRKLSPDIVLMAPRWVFSSVALAAGVYKAQIVEFDVERDDLSEVAQCADLGVRSMIFSRRKSWEELASYVEYQPDMVNLDYPARFKIVATYPLVRAHFRAMTEDHMTRDYTGVDYRTGDFMTGDYMTGDYMTKDQTS